MATHDPTELAWSENPESITIGEAETVSFKFKYYSLYQNKISISISPETTEKIKTPSLTREIVGKDYWATVTVAGNIKGSGNVELTVVTYQTMSITSKKITKIKVVKATNAIQIKFFDTDNKPLANNKLIAPKYICDISQGEDDPNKEGIEKYITELHKMYKQKTIKRKIASVKAFYNYLEEEELNYLEMYLQDLAALPEYTEAQKEAYTLSAMAGDLNAQKTLMEILTSNINHMFKIMVGKMNGKRMEKNKEQQGKVKI